MSQKEENIEKGCGGKGCERCEDCERKSASGACDGCNPSCENNGGCAGKSCAGAGCGCCDSGNMRGKLHSYNYFEDIPGGYADDDMVEVQFKNTRKGYYLNSTNIPLEVGDMVAVEAAPGHDIGVVSLIGALVRLQMRKAGVKPDAEKRRVFRKARQSDIERYEKAKALENDTMIRSRKIAKSLQLNMKIGDVEYQGDGNKAIFYYIADERVDFRQLIKVLAETFKVRIEMKQIGARQEAGRIGGIGPCGRPLCCTTWMTNFVSVSTGAARYQDISLNPQKLAGQCAKLKCCLNFEVDAYVEASRKLPGKDIRLETADSTYYYFKSDIFRGEITYSTDKHIPANLVTLTAREAWEIIEMNKRGEKPAKLKDESAQEKQVSEYADILGQDSVTRFDNKKRKKRKPKDNASRQQQGANGQGGESRRGKKPKDDERKDAQSASDTPKEPRQPQQRNQQRRGDKNSGDGKPAGEKRERPNNGGQQRQQGGGGQRHNKQKGGGGQNNKPVAPEMVQE